MAYSRGNPDNPRSTLFKQLTRLLSGPITNYRRQSPRQLKRRQLDKYRFKSASGQPFKKHINNPLQQLYLNARNNQNRAERYIDFDQMEFSPECGAALDIYADEMTTSSPLRKILNINCPNEEIKGILESLYFERMNIDFNLFGWSRNMCKYGDHILYLDIDPKEGIKNFIGLPIMEVERLEGEDPTNPSYVQFQWNSGGITFENWQIAHFRILGNDKYAPYGCSIYDPARRIWRQLTLQEEAMMTYRIVRSSERRVFKIDVGGIPEEEVEQFMQKVMTDMKRNQIVDPNTGKVELRYNPLSIEEDIFLPVIGNNSATSIETLSGGQYTGDVDDVKYLRGKLLAALKIPASYLISEDSTEDKTTLAQKDISFARTIQRLQRCVTSELEKIGVIHLFILGYREKDLLSFKVSLNNPSKLAELQELEHWKTKFEVAGAATEGFFSKRWVSKNILDMSDEVFLRNIRERYFDAKLEASIEQIANAAENEGDLGGGDGLEGLDMGSEDSSGEEMEEPEDDSALLASPGKRPNEEYLTPRSKGKFYKPVVNDKRISGARKRSMRGQYNDEASRNTPRNVFKGSSEMKTLAHGIYEDLESSYKKIQEEESLNELKLLKHNQEIKLMIESLEKKSQSWNQNE